MARRTLTLALLLVLGLTLVAGAASRDIEIPFAKRATGLSEPPTRGRILDEIIYYEDWEDGDLARWTPVDLTALPSAWHIDDYEAFGGTGTSWWMGDTTIGANGGYTDDWYMALNSPSITLPATNPMMLFWHRYSCEDPAGATAPYNGWDGMNLRISTDGGGSWTVVPSAALTPAYDRTSLYSFGFQHGEGANIPGWCGVNTGRNWHLQTANLATWAGQTVKLRWAFASDPAFSTPNNQTMFGWMVDNIRVYSGTDTVFTDDCNAVGDWVTVNVRPTGGNLWRVDTDATSPAGSHVIVCNNAGTSLYNANMNDVLESPDIDVSDLPYGLLLFDVQVTGAVACEPPPFPDCDYWGMEVSTDGGFTWCTVSNPTCDPNGTNYVYADCPTFWASFNESYSTTMDFSALIGNIIRFRFTFQSNSDALYAVGPKFDGFVAEYTSGFANDVSCYSLQVRYPTIVNRPATIKAYFKNEGQNSQNNLQGWWHIVPQNWRAFLPPFSLDPGQIATRDTAMLFSTVGLFTMQARVVLGTDENMQNDTATADFIEVGPVGSDLEIGYDNRTTQWAFNFATGRGALVHFTPFSDSTVTGAYNIKTIRAQYNGGQLGDLPIQYHVYADDANAPGTELYEEEVIVLQTEVGGIWKDVDVTDESGLQNLTGDYWVWLEVVNEDPTSRYPQILGDDAQLWDDIHNYTWDGPGDNHTQSDFFYLVHTVLGATSATPEHSVELPSQWSLEQNYPNPFNPMTEIRYSVPRADHVTLKVFDVLGREVATLVNEAVQAGVYRASFDGSNLASGVYFYSLESRSFSATRKMLLMK